jgi:molybdopterin converting factor small subunit
VRVEVRLFATLTVYLPALEGGSATLDLPEETTVGQAIRSLGIPDATPRIAVINGLDAGPEQPLRDGDTLSVFPPLAGGV